MAETGKKPGGLQRPAKPVADAWLAPLIDKIRSGLVAGGLRQRYEGAKPFSEWQGSAASDLFALEAIAKKYPKLTREQVLNQLYSHPNRRGARSGVLNAAEARYGKFPKMSPQAQSLFREQFPYKLPRDIRITSGHEFGSGSGYSPLPALSQALRDQDAAGIQRILRPGKADRTRVPPQLDVNIGDSPRSYVLRHEMEHAAQFPPNRGDIIDSLRRSIEGGGDSPTRTAFESSAGIGDVVNLGELSRRLRDGKGMDHTVEFAPGMRMDLSHAIEEARKYGYFGETSMSPHQRTMNRMRRGLPLNESVSPVPMTTLLGGHQEGRQFWNDIFRRHTPTPRPPSPQQPWHSAPPSAALEAALLKPAPGEKPNLTEIIANSMDLKSISSLIPPSPPPATLMPESAPYTEAAASEALKGPADAFLQQFKTDGKEGAASDVLGKLLSAKSESDRKNYPAKHELLRRLIKESPGEFRIDSEEGGIYGLTHAPTGFKIHMPKAAAPPELRANARYVRVDVGDAKGKKLLHHFIRDNKWGSPAGRIEEGEDPAQAAVRELLERTGYEGAPEDLAPHGTEDGTHVYSVALEKLKQVAQPGERGGYSTKIKLAPSPADLEKEGAGDIKNPRVRFVLPYEDQYLMQEAISPKWKGWKRHAGGGIDEGEEPEDAALREFEEEFGKKLTRAQLKYLGLDPRGGTYSKHHFYEVLNHGLAPNRFQASNDPDEIVQLVKSLQSGDKYLGPDMKNWKRTRDKKAEYPEGYARDEFRRFMKGWKPGKPLHPGIQHHFDAYRKWNETPSRKRKSNFYRGLMHPRFPLHLELLKEREHIEKQRQQKPIPAPKPKPQFVAGTPDIVKKALARITEKQAGPTFSRLQMPGGNQTMRHLFQGVGGPIEQGVDLFNSPSDYLDEMMTIPYVGEAPLYSDKKSLWDNIKNLLMRPINRRERQRNEREHLLRTQWAVQSLGDHQVGAPSRGFPGLPGRGRLNYGQQSFQQAQARNLPFISQLILNEPGGYRMIRDTGKASTWLHMGSGYQFTVPNKPDPKDLLNIHVEPPKQDLWASALRWRQGRATSDDLKKFKLDKASREEARRKLLERQKATTPILNEGT